MSATNDNGTQESYNYSSKPNPGSLGYSNQQDSSNHSNTGNEKNSQNTDEKSPQYVPQNGAAPTGKNPHHGNSQDGLQNIGTWATGQQPETQTDYPTDIEISGNNNDPQKYSTERHIEQNPQEGPWSPVNRRHG